MGFMKIITAEGVQDIEDMSMEELLGLQVAFMAEKDKQFFSQTRRVGLTDIAMCDQIVI